MPLKLLEPGFASVTPFQFTWCTRGHSRHRELGVPGHAWLPPPHRLSLGRGIASSSPPVWVRWLYLPTSPI